MTAASALRLAFLLVAIAGLAWNVASVIEAWRIAGFRLRIVFRRAQRPSNVLPFRRAR